MTGPSLSPPSGLSRETSEVLNRVIISMPEIDIELERERMADPILSSAAAGPKVRRKAVAVGERGSGKGRLIRLAVS
jgi:protein-serine/threonine kinase